MNALKESLAADEFHHQGNLPNNFIKTIPAGQQALKAVSAFKDEFHHQKSLSKSIINIIRDNAVNIAV